MVDNYDTLYLEGPNKLQYPFVMMGEMLVLCLDKRHHSSSVGVMHDLFVGLLKGCSSLPGKDCNTEPM
jgi:hypothetical protein